ncbi:MAG: hypothetical protein PF517_14875 [Salinivirgaceae bacterium]|jgi:hypothetical protein|nr:hypothetical protein [Salinivirgaceae bacterium]
MKTILSYAINAINWNTVATINHILHTKRKHETFFQDQILEHLNQVNKLDFIKGKLIDGVKSQKIDLIEVNPSIPTHHFVLEPNTKKQILVSRLIEFGHNSTHQPQEYNINKTLSDIKKRTISQKLKNDLYTVQVVLDIRKQKKIKKELLEASENLVDNSSKLQSIETDYIKLDSEHRKIHISLNQESDVIDIYFYICGPFNSSSWEFITKVFKDYKTAKGALLKVVHD